MINLASAQVRMGYCESGVLMMPRSLKFRFWRNGGQVAVRRGAGTLICQYGSRLGSSEVVGITLPILSA